MLNHQENNLPKDLKVKVDKKVYIINHHNLSYIKQNSFIQEHKNHKSKTKI